MVSGLLTTFGQDWRHDGSRHLGHGAGGDPARQPGDGRRLLFPDEDRQPGKWFQSLRKSRDLVGGWVVPVCRPDLALHAQTAWRQTRLCELRGPDRKGSRWALSCARRRQRPPRRDGSAPGPACGFADGRRTDIRHGRLFERPNRTGGDSRRTLCRAFPGPAGIGPPDRCRSASARRRSRGPFSGSRARQQGDLLQGWPGGDRW